MKTIHHAIELGATLYVPATHPQLFALTQGEKIPQLRSIAVCLEDAVLEQDVPTAMLNLKQLLQQRLHEPSLHQPALFIRPRGLDMAKRIFDWDLHKSFDGMILPKFHLHDLELWRSILPAQLHYMPTFESKEFFDHSHNIELLQALKYDFHKVLCLRIGGNDLLSCLHLRRPKDVSIYETPIGSLIAQLSGLFISAGFSMSAPVCEHIEQSHLLHHEVAQDLRFGLYTKTCIHPKQVELIQQHYRVSTQDLHDAQAILAPDAKSVFKSYGSMLEPATHKNWAEMILLRHRHFGMDADLSAISIA